MPKTYFLIPCLSSHRGRKREQNEDAVGYLYPREINQLYRYGALFILADGVGGVVDGEYASDMALGIILERYYNSTLTSVDKRLVEAITAANSALYHETGVGATTVVAAVILGDTLTIANVGDSPAFWLEPEAPLAQLTDDHIIVPDPAKPKKRKLTRALGHKPDVQVDTVIGPLTTGGRLLMVSDGATRYLSNDWFAAQYDKRANPTTTVTQIIEQSVFKGGTDNISAIVVDIGSECVDEQRLRTYIKDQASAFIVLPDPLPLPAPQPTATVMPPAQARPPERPTPVHQRYSSPQTRRGVARTLLLMIAVVSLIGAAYLLIAAPEDETDTDQADSSQNITPGSGEDVHPTAAPATSTDPATVPTLTITPAAPPTSTLLVNGIDPTAPPPPSNTATLDLILHEGDQVIFSDSALTYNSIGDDVAAFVISPQKTYTIQRTYVSTRDEKIWYRLYDMAKDNYGWIGEDTLPPYEKVD